MDSHLSFTILTGKRLHLGISGSVAGYKALDLLRDWSRAGIHSGATVTRSAARFLSPLLFQALGASPVYDAMFAADSSLVHDEVFPHLAPGTDADAMVMVAASATLMARLAHGLADDLLACQALAFPGPIVIAPAMNPRMWSNPATRQNWQILRDRGHILVEPDDGLVACNEQGSGRLADTREIYLAGIKALAAQDMVGKTVMVTLGPTREYWDAVRFWSNPSTGTMGAALAVAAYLRGATVHAVCGPGTPWLPRGIVRHEAVSADSMFEVASSLWSSTDIGVFNAAVADFGPVPIGNQKFKKNEASAGFSLEFKPNRDILKTLAADKRPGQKVIAFAAETSDLVNSAQAKLVSKNADMIVANEVNVPDSGFGSGGNQGFVADCTGANEWWPAQGKADMAWRIIDWLLRL